MNESTVRVAAAVAVAFRLLRDGARGPTIAAQTYPWVPGGGGSTGVYRLADIPVTDVPLLTAEQIAAFSPWSLITALPPATGTACAVGKDPEHRR